MSPVFVIAIAACQNPADSASPGKNQPPNAHEDQYQDISKLPLAQAIADKYSRLQLVCEETASYLLWPVDGNSAPLVETNLGAKEVVWDILKNPAATNTINLQHTYPSMDYAYEIDANLKIVAGSDSVVTADGKTVDLINGVEVTGPTKGHLVYLNAKGVIMTSNSTFTSDNSIIDVESMTSSIVNNKWNLNPTDPNPGLKIECTIEAELNPAFAGDSKEVAN